MKWGSWSLHLCFECFTPYKLLIIPWIQIDLLSLNKYLPWVKKWEETRAFSFRFKFWNTAAHFSIKKQQLTHWNEILTLTLGRVSLSGVSVVSATRWRWKITWISFEDIKQQMDSLIDRCLHGKYPNSCQGRWMDFPKKKGSGGEPLKPNIINWEESVKRNF